MEIELPYNLDYRDYQKQIVSYFRNWGKRAVKTWHRRAWKDKVDWNITIEMSVRDIWWYAYVFPTYAQGKKVIWDSIDKNGKKFKDHIPPPLMLSDNWTELKINLKNGSFIQVLGSDNIDSLRGISPKWIVFSEFAFQNPTAWEVMRPILAENGWWALFNSTPNGKNHFYDLCNIAELSSKTDKIWFFQKLTVDDTKDEDGKSIVSKEYIEEERRNWMSEEMIQQEYFCSFYIGAIGSYYAKEIEQARQDWRITKLPFNPDIPVDLYFDLWVNDNFTISWKQNDWHFFNFINYYEENGKTLDHYFFVIDNWFDRKIWKIGKIYLPHDSAQKSHAFLVSGTTIIEKFKEKYPWKVEFIPNKVWINDWIQEARKLFPRCRFDSENCIQLIRCLENYKKGYDDVKKVFRDQPYHDWSSHWADNFRYFAVSDKRPEEPIQRIQVQWRYF